MLVGHEIIPGLYQRGMFKRYSLERKLAMMEGAKIMVVVNMITDCDEELMGWMGRYGLLYYHLPIPDGKIADYEKIHFAGREVAQALRFKKNVIVHCRAGRNRSALISALAVREIMNVSGKQAIEIVRRGRPNSLANEHFVRYLEGLDVPELHHR